ncbi:MAG: hypothetical protein ABIH20_03670 [Candidatus Diapherotrites archaeon]
MNLEDFFNDEKAQGSQEYIMLIGGAVLIAIVIITLVLSLTGTSKGTTAGSVREYDNIFERFRRD